MTLTHRRASVTVANMRASFRGSAVAVVFSTNLLLGQATGRVTGVVTDPTDAVVPSAHVAVANTQTKVRLETVTNQDGIFQFPELPIGSYEITAVAAGFKTLARGPI